MDTDFRTEVENGLHHTTDYDKFSLMHNNRDANRSHIEALKDAFVEKGNLTIVQPILVNESLQIIDGQHRYIAAKELGQPIYYTIREGLTIGDARSMNILHRAWTNEDFAWSYAEGGNQQYKDYLKLREDFGFGHAVTMNYIYGGDVSGVFGIFRRGELQIADPALVRERLSKLYEVLEKVPENMIRDKNIAYALLKIMKNPVYDQRRMLQKMELFGSATMRRFGDREEYLRALEETYNYRAGENNRIRLY